MQTTTSQNNPAPVAIKGNIGLWYYRTFFSEYFKPSTPPQSNEKKFKEWLQLQYDPVLHAAWGAFSRLKDDFATEPWSNTSFSLCTVYPGLVCGIGYEHELSITNEFKLGFAFDHTTGLPYIPGSSVKGTLRSAFRHGGYPKSIILDWIDAIENPSPEKTVPVELTDKVAELKKIVLPATDWEKVEKQIFEGIEYLSGTKDENPYQRDIFFDACISGVVPADQRFLADDYITCHQNRKNPELSPFTEPNPVRFLKVRSGVEFTFSFRLSDTVVANNVILSKTVKTELFKHFLLTLGIGAKTNVGYGQFE